MSTPKVCPVCSAELPTTKRAHAVYCSPRCRHTQAHRRTRVLAQIGRAVWESD